MYGNGDAVIGVNPASDSIPAVIDLVRMLDEIIVRYEFDAVMRARACHDEH